MLLNLLGYLLLELEDLADDLEDELLDEELLIDDELLDEDPLE